MKWLFPAKTFLVGEYVALQGGPALILTTEPCFLVSLENGTPACDFPVNSPAYNLWKKDLSSYNYKLHWQDPYFGLGGLGASSAQFLGAYYARNYILQNTITHKKLLADYLKYAWNGQGIPPSGYDVLAQSMGGCVYLEKNSNTYQSYTWPFIDIAFVLLHTGKKQATHVYLQNLLELNNLDKLTQISTSAYDNFINNNAEGFINAVNDYYLTLCQLNLIAQHTQEMVETLKNNQDILAIKGCGAMGADILLLIVESNKIKSITSKIEQNGYNIITHGTAISIFR